MLRDAACALEVAQTRLTGNDDCAPDDWPSQIGLIMEMARICGGARLPRYSPAHAPKAGSASLLCKQNIARNHATNCRTKELIRSEQNSAHRLIQGL